MGLGYSAPKKQDKPPAKAAAPVAKAPAVAAPKPKLSFRAIAAALSGDSAKARGRNVGSEPSGLRTHGVPLKGSIRVPIRDL